MNGGSILDRGMDFFLRHSVQTGFEPTQPPIQLGTEGSFPP